MGKKQMPPIIVDTRETLPYLFTNDGAEITRSALKSGDYSVAGYESRIAIERKTKADAYQSLGKNRARFKRQIERLAEFEYAAIIIECSMEDFIEKPPTSTMMSPRAAMNTLVSWSVRFGIHVWFAGCRLRGENLTLRLLEKFVKACEAGE